MTARSFFLTAGLSAAIACAASLAPPADTASAKIIPGRGVAGVNLTEPREAMLARLGTPASVARTPGPGGYRRHSFRGLEVYTDERGRVFMFVITGRAQATRSGIRVGSTLRRLKQAYADDLRCERELGKTVACALRTTWRQTGIAAETSSTDFLISDSGKVERISIYAGWGG